MKVGAIVLAIVVGLIVNAWADPADFENSIREIVRRENQGLPRMIDGISRLDRETISDRKLVYHSTIVTDINFEDLRPQLEVNLRSLYCDRMPAFAQHGWSVEWRYSSVDGRQLGTVTKNPSSCS